MDGNWDLLRVPPHPSVSIVWRMEHLAVSSMQVKVRNQTGKKTKEPALRLKLPSGCLCGCVNLKFIFPPWVLLSSTVNERNLAQQKVNQAWFHRRLTGQDRWLTPPPWWGKVWKEEKVIGNGKRRQRRRIKTRQEGAKCPNGCTSFSLTAKIKGLVAGR